MKNLAPKSIKNKTSLSKKKISKRINKHVCTHKVSKFRTQPIKLHLNVMYFWQRLNNTDFAEVQYLNIDKYNQIKLHIESCEKPQKVIINLSLNKLHAKSRCFLPWFYTTNNIVVVADLQNNHVVLINSKKIHIITIGYKKKKTSSLKLAKLNKLFKYIIKNPKNKNTKLFQKRMVKFSKKWFKFERNKFKRFKNKYDGRDVKKKAPLQTIKNLAASKFKKYLFKTYQSRWVLIKEELVIEKNNNIRRRELLKNIKTTAKVSKNKKKKQKISKKRKYSWLKSLYSGAKLRKTVKILNITSTNSDSVKKKAKTAKLNKNATKIRKKIKAFKIKLFQQLFFSHNKKKQKQPKRSFKAKKLKYTVKKINRQIKYKLKWFNYYEFKAFRWKFKKKRWYFIMSKWKRLAEFKRMLRNAWRNYRKLQKNFLFIKLLRANFKHIMGINEGDLLKIWTKIRRGTNANSTTSSIDFLNQQLQLKLDGFSMFLGLAPNRLLAQELVHFGGLRVNGLVVTNKNFSLHQNDMLQLDIKVIKDICRLYKDAHWNSVHARLKFTSFLQVQWSIMLFMLVRAPQNYELLEESILNQRWVRFFIRYFPVRISKFKKAKVKWYKY